MTVDAEDFRRQMGRTVDEMELSLEELQDAGACVVCRESNTPEIEMNAQLASLSTALSDGQTSDAPTVSIRALRT
jgi:hypothetical protein